MDLTQSNVNILNEILHTSAKYIANQPATQKEAATLIACNVVSYDFEYQFNKY